MGFCFNQYSTYPEIIPIKLSEREVAMDEGKIHEEALCLHPVVEGALKEAGIEYRAFPCDPELADTMVFCKRYDFSPAQAANAIIVAAKDNPVRYACCVVLATTRLDVNKCVRRLMDGKKVSFASGEETVRLTGMQIGGVAPFGLPPIPIYVDLAVMEQPQVIAGGGNRSSKVILAPSQFKKLSGVEIISGLAVPRPPQEQS